MSDAEYAGPTFAVRAVATWTADDGAPTADSLGRTRVATTRAGRMAAHVVSALPSLSELRRTRPGWVVASATIALEGVVGAAAFPRVPIRIEAVAPDGPANELAARVGGLRPWTTVAAGQATFAMALIEAAAQLALGTEDVVVIVVETEVPAALGLALPYEPLAVALHLAADPGPEDIAMLAGPDAVHAPIDRPAGAYAGSPGAPALLLARAASRGEAATVRFGASAAGADPWRVRVKPVGRPGAG